MGDMIPGMGADETTDVPRSIGKYEILALLARGGMAEVFLGRTTGEGGFEKLVAVKRIHPVFASDRDFVEMFMDEARISATLHNSNIGQVFDFGRVGSTYYIAMEFIQGLSLKALFSFCQQRPKHLGRLPIAAHVVANICAALQYAHDRRDSQDQPQNIIHRDVSPTNVLLTFEGEVKLIDFGIAKATQRMRNTASSVIKGKYSYMAPEQVEAKELDYRVDIFSAGIILYELITATRLFEAETDLGVLNLVRLARVPVPSSVAPGLPQELDKICLRALAREPGERYPSAARMQAELERFCFKSSFGRQQLGRFMKKAFATEWDKKRQLIRQAREEFQARFDAASTNVLSPVEVEDLKAIPTMDLEPDTTVPSAQISLLGSDSSGVAAAQMSDTLNEPADSLIPAGPDARTVTSPGPRTPSTTTMASGEWPPNTDAVPALPAPKPQPGRTARALGLVGLVVAALVALGAVVFVIRQTDPPRRAATSAAPAADDNARKEPGPDLKSAGPRVAPGWTCAVGMKAPCVMARPVTFQQWRKIATRDELDWDTGTSPSAFAVYLPHDVCQTYCRRLGFRLPTDSELQGLSPASVPGSPEPLQEWTSTKAGKGRWRICAGETCHKQAGSERQTDIGFRCAADRVVE